LQCDPLSIPKTSLEAIQSIREGDYKPLAIEDEQIILNIIGQHNVCVNNARDARRLQKEMTKGK
jgi:hypothetical protein